MMQELLESLRIDELVSGRGDDCARGLNSLAEICCSEGNFGAGLKYIQEARSLVPADDFNLLGNVLNSEAYFLLTLERYQEALLVREKLKDLCLRQYGPNHPNYATSLINTAILYAKLKQMSLAVDLASKAVAMFLKILGPSHPYTQNAQNDLADFQKALTDPEMKEQLVSKSRMCNIDGCNTVKENMSVVVSNA